MNLKDLAEDFRLALRNSSSFRPTDPEEWNWLVELSQQYFERVQKETMAARIEWPSEEWTFNAMEGFNYEEKKGAIAILKLFRDNIIRIATGEFI